jgi:AhpD family alkylhydroperoxidase
LIAPSSEPLNLFKVLVRSPELMKRVNALGGLFMAHGSLQERERELVILRVAWNSGCDYEFAQHAPIGRRFGLSHEEIRNLGRKPEAGDWGEVDLGLIRLTDELMYHLEASDATWDLVSRGRDHGQMMELVLLVGYYQMLAAFARTVRVPIEPDREGFPPR